RRAGGLTCRRRASDGDDDLAACAAVSEVADRLRYLFERERPVDDGPDRAGFEKLPQFLQVLPTFLRDEETELLPDERRECGGAQLTADAEPVACVLSADDHQRPPRCQRPPELGKRAVTSDVENDVVAVATVSEILSRVIDHVVGTNRAHQL